MHNLKILRTDRGLSQKAVAAVLGITQQAYANYERGARQADYRSLENLANYFGVSIDYLLGREEKWQKKVRSSEDERTLQILSESEELRRVIDLAATLPEAEQKNLAEYVALRAAQLGKEHQK